MLRIPGTGCYSLLPLLGQAWKTASRHRNQSPESCGHACEYAWFPEIGGNEMHTRFEIQVDGQEPEECDNGR